MCISYVLGGAQALEAVIIWRVWVVGAWGQQFRNNCGAPAVCPCFLPLCALGFFSNRSLGGSVPTVCLAFRAH